MQPGTQGDIQVEAGRFPQHDTLRALAAERQTAQRFYDYLVGKGIHLCTADSEGYQYCGFTPQVLIAEFLGIDLDALGAEKEWMFGLLVGDATADATADTDTDTETQHDDDQDGGGLRAPHPEAGRPFHHPDLEAIGLTQGFVVGVCGHRVAGSEFKVGLYACERCDLRDFDLTGVTPRPVAAG